VKGPERGAAGASTPATFSRGGVLLLVLLGGLFVWLAIDLLLLVFTGILAAIFLRSLSYWVAEYTPLTNGGALAAVVVVLLGGFVGSGIFFAPVLAEQTQQLAETLPKALSEIEGRVRRNPFGDWVLSRALERAARARQAQNGNGEDRPEGRGGPQPLPARSDPAPGEEGEGEEKKPDMQDAQEVVVDQATGLAPRLLHGIIGLVVVLFTAVYLAAHPQPYIRGFLRLFPLGRRHRIGEVLYACGYTLRWWLYGQLLAMAAVGTMMGVGLAIIGVPLAFALGVVAGLFEFIPTLGPMLGLLPALTLALTKGGDAALWVLGLYTVVQAIEGYLLTPLVQQRVVHLPPVVTIAAQIFFAWTMGPLGLLIAVPLIAVVLVSVQMLYVEDFLGDDMNVEAEDEGRIAHATAAPMEDEDTD
jgi:predicted PurR-regulated permease PerM